MTTYQTILLMCLPALALVIGFLIGRRKPKWVPKLGEWAVCEYPGEDIIVWILGVQNGKVYYCFFVRAGKYAYISETVQSKPLFWFRCTYKPCPSPEYINRPEYLK